MISVTELERIAAAGWPGTDSMRLGGWLLRSGGGFTGRANSVLPLESPGTALGDALDCVLQFYHHRGQQARAQMPCAPSHSVAGTPNAALDPALDSELDRLGWSTGEEAAVLIADLTTMLAECGEGADLPPVELSNIPSPDWLAGYRYRGHDLPPKAVAVLLAGGHPVFARIGLGTQRAGVARGIVTDGWLGVTAVTVEPAHRRRGVATALMAGLGRWALDSGADHVYLQVAAENDVAFALYRGLGFVEHHRYHYRTEPTASA